MFDMISMNSNLNEIKEFVKCCLDQLYSIDDELFKRNNGKGVSERAICFRLAHYLQNEIGSDFFVDCDYNSSDRGKKGTAGKPISNPDGSKTKRFIDIIIHKREPENKDNLICIEIKKWNNKNRKKFEKDKNNLRVLTLQYGYHMGFI